MKLLKLLFLVSLTSCALFSTPKHVSEVKVSNADLWKGRSVNELTLHPVYATLPLIKRTTTDGVEILSFKNSGGVVSRANCAGGACGGYSGEVACNHVYYIVNKKVFDLKRVGSCGEERMEFRPLDANNEPVLADIEKEYLERKIAAEGPVRCEKTSDCQGTKSCKNNTCMDLGLWGLIFNR